MSTAPAPNAAAPPGMCPAVATLGGAGGAGGSDAGAGGGPGGNGGNGNGNGNGANPDQHGAAGAGEPIDPITGRVYTTPLVDLALSGPLPFSFQRVYSSAMADREVGLGFGWTHSLGWHIEVRRTSLRVWNEQGISVDFEDPPAVGEERVGRFGWLLRRHATGFELDVDDGVFRSFSESAGATRWLLSEIRDRAGNEIALRHEDGRLAGALDSAGREVRFVAAGGRIGAVEVKNAAAQGRWVTFAQYEYDGDGNLVKVTDAEGYAWTYTYDARHRLTSHTGRTGLTFQYVYDREGRAVESWGSYPAVDPALAADVPVTLADGETRAKGIFHVKIEHGPNGYREVVDSRGLKRFFGNALGLVDKLVDGTSVIDSTYDERGFLIAEADAVGATSKYERDVRGRVLKKIDPLGRETTLTRDAAGLVVRATDGAGATTEITRDARGLPTARRGPTGAVTRTVYDARGLVVEEHDPLGGVRRYLRDEHGNAVQMTEQGGAVWRCTYDYWGRTTAVIAPTGASITYRHSNRGDLLSKTGPDGATSHYRYDGERHLVEQTDAAGRSVKLGWGGYHSICSRTDENGHTIRLTYDRECDLVTVVNERGEEHRFTRNAMGNTIEERTFDGRHLRYRHDAMGRLVRIENESGAVTRMELNLVGDVVSRTGEDGVVEAFTHDARGLIASVTSAGVKLAFERDALGRIVREVQEVDGEAFSVDVDYDIAGRRIARRTSRGHAVELDRNAMGDVRGARLDGTDVLTFARDGLGRETMRTLGGGGRIDSAFDISGRLVRRAASTGARGRAVGPGEPDWVGPLPEGITTDSVYRYDPVGDLVESWDMRRGRTRHEHDPAGRLLASIREQGRSEQFAFDATDNLFEQGPGAPAREYGNGNRLLKRGNVRYVWDADGRLVEKRRTLDDGAAEVTRFQWNGRGLLQSVERPDGTTVAFRYDAFARRVEKKVSRRDAPAARPRVVSTTRFHWDRHVPVHEVTHQGDDVVGARTYVFEEGSFEPLAQREGAAGDGGDWVHLVNDQIGTPEKLLDGRGEVVGELRLSTWGETGEETGAARTPLRFQGQYADEETGLCYNRHRYYDPEVGRFISPDPIGLLGGTNQYSRGVDSSIDIDPFGLQREYPFDIMRHKGELSAEEQNFKAQIGTAHSFYPPNTRKCQQASNHFSHNDPDNRHSIGIDTKDGDRLKLLPGVGPANGWGNHYAAELKDGRVVDVDRGIMFQDRKQWLEHTVQNPTEVQVNPTYLPGRAPQSQMPPKDYVPPWTPKFND